MHLGIADVLGAGPVNDMHDRGNHNCAGDRTLGVLLYVFCMAVNGLEPQRPRRVVLDLLLQVLHGAAIAHLSMAGRAEAKYSQQE